MAIQFADSFDVYGTVAANLDGIYTRDFAILETAFARTGTCSIKFANNNGMRKAFPNPQLAIGVAFGFYISKLPDAGQVGNILSGFVNAAGNEICHFGILSNGAIQAMRGGVVLAVSNPILSGAVWLHIEIYVLSNTANGYIELRVNGQSALTIVNANTCASPADPVIAQHYWYCAAPLGNYPFWIDDYVIWDTTGGVNNGFLGDRRCITLLPSADAAPTQWSNSSGANGFSLVNETVPDDSTYVASDTVGQKETFTLPDLPANAYTVAGLVLFQRLIKTDAGDAAVKVSIITGVSQVQSGNIFPTLAPAQYSVGVLNTNPLTNARFTPAEVNAAYYQIERTL